MQTNVVIPLPRDNLFGLIGNVTSNAINIFERKLSVKGAVRAGKGFFFFQWRYQNHKIAGRFGCINCFSNICFSLYKWRWQC